PPTAVGHGFGAVANHLAAFEQLRDQRMFLEFLEHALRVETRVGVVESGDEAKGHYVVFAALAFRTIDPGTAVFFGSEGPAKGVDDFAGSDAAGGNLPELFDADAVSLRVGV